MNKYFMIEDKTGSLYYFETLKKLLKKAKKMEKKGRSVTCEVCLANVRCT